MKSQDILGVMQQEKRNGEAVRRQLERLLSSAAFARSERLSAFLRLVVEGHLEGRGDEIKESLIAVEVFARKPDYDPQRDSIVRTEAVRLRARLTEYYAGEGSGDPVVVELPKGGYTPAFRRRVATREERKAQARWLWLGGLFAPAVLALAALGWWWIQHKSAPIPIAVLPLKN